MIVSFHVTHSSAGVSGINNIIPLMDETAEKLILSLPYVSEYIIIKTCNRFEIYAATSDNSSFIASLENFAKSIIPHNQNDKNAWYVLHDENSVKQLFKVTCGLDSLIVGEDQIQGQIKGAYLEAKKNGHALQILTKLFDKALHVGKRVRSETALNNGAISVGSAAVELAKIKLNGLEGRKVAILGAGDIATVVAKNLCGNKPETIFVSSRTYEHAKILADQLNGTAIGMERISDVLRISELLIVATSAPHVLLHRNSVEAAMTERDKKLVIIDISIPRNVADDVGLIDNVELDTMEEIRALSADNLWKRQSEIANAEKIINEELKKLDRERKERIANTIISEIGKKVSEIRKEELQIALTRAENGADIGLVFDDFSRALVSKIMAEPYEKLKEASRNGNIEVCNFATDLFGVENK